LIGRRGTYVGTTPVAGTGRIGFGSTTSGPDRVEGDHLYIVATATDTAVSAVPTFGSTPAGWTKIDDQSSGTRTRHALFYKLSDGTEGNVDITATGSGTIEVATAAVSLTGGDRNTGILGSGAVATGTWNTADVTTVEEHSSVWAFLGCRTTGSFTATDCIEHVDTAGGASVARVGIFEQLTKDPSTRDLEGTTSGTTTEPWAFVIVMEPNDGSFTEDFNYTESLLSNDGKWAQFSGLSVQEVQTDGAQAKGFSSGATANATYRTNVFERDYEFELEVTTKGAASDLISLFLRINNPGSGTYNALEARVTPSAGTDTVAIYRVVGGTATSIASVSQEINNGDVIKFKAIGTHYTVELDTGSGFTEILAVNDTGSVVTRGYPGFRIGGTTVRVDNAAGARIAIEGHAEYVHALTSGGSLTAATTNNITLPIAYPGDVWLLHIHTNRTTGGDPTVTIPGFTEFGSYLNGTDHKYFLFYRECDGTEGAVDAATIVKVATASQSTRWRTGGLSVIGDADDIFGTDPLNENVEGASTTWQTDSIAQPAGDLLVTWVNHEGANTNTCANDDAAAVETQDAATNSSGTHVAVYIKRIITGTTDDATGTLSGSNAKVSFIYTVKAAPAAPTVDADTITLTFTPSFVEVAETVDSGTVYLLFTPSGVDEYTGAQEYIDSGEIYLTFTPSGVEVADFVDSGTIGLLFTPSGTELIIHEYTDTGEVYLLFTPSGVELLHQCKPRFRGTLLTWLYDPDALTVDWFGGVLLPDWYGELLQVEMVANYAC
jgi:hypothetical protein